MILRFLRILKLEQGPVRLQNIIPWRMRSLRVQYARRGLPPCTTEGMTSQHNILPECGMTDFCDAGRFVGQMWRRLMQYAWREMAHLPPT